MEGDQVTKLVERVLARVRDGEVPDREIEMPGAPRGVFKTVDAAMDAAEHAQIILVTMPLEKRREIIANIRKWSSLDLSSLSLCVI